MKKSEEKKEAAGLQNNGDDRCDRKNRVNGNGNL